MTVIRCPPSEHEYTIKYQDKTYFGEYKKIQNAVKQIGISSPIMHYPYICQEEGCGIRFMFHADITEHYMLHHNISSPKIEFKKLNFPSHRYTPEARKNDGFFTLDELMDFTEEDFKKYNVLINRKNKTPPCNDSICPSKKRKSAPSIEKIENLLHDFVSGEEEDYTPEKSNILRAFQKEAFSNSHTESQNSTEEAKKEKVNTDGGEETMVIDLTKAPDDIDSDDGIEVLGDYNINKSEIQCSSKNYSTTNTLSTGSSPTKSSLKTFSNNRQLLQSPSDGRRTPERPSRPTPTRALRNSPIFQIKNILVDKARSPKISIGSMGSDATKRNSSQNSKSSYQSPNYTQHMPKSRDYTSRDERDVMRKVTQILHENAPKPINGVTKNNNVDGVNNVSNFSSQKNQYIKQPSGGLRLPQKNICHNQGPVEQIPNVTSSTNSTTTMKPNVSPKRLDKIYYCMFSEDCNFFTRYRINYEKHMSEHAIITFLFRCNSCPLVFQTENVFIEHKTKYCINSVGPVRPLLHINVPRRQEFINLANYYDLIMCRYSEVCSFVCNTNEELRYHIQELHEHDQILYTCMKCNSFFKDKVALSIHSRNYCWKTMEVQITEGRLMRCHAESCDFSSHSIPEWHIHLTSHLYIGDRTPYECSKCYTFLATKTAQVEHERYFCSLIKPKLVDLPTRNHCNMNI